MGRVWNTKIDEFWGQPAPLFFYLYYNIYHFK